VRRLLGSEKVLGLLGLFIACTLGCSIRAVPSARVQAAAGGGTTAVNSTTPPSAVTGGVSGLASSATSLAKSAGDRQTALASTPVSLTVVVYDINNKPVTDGTQIDWAIVSGAGRLDNITTLANPSGQATVNLTLGDLPTTNTVSASVHGKAISTLFTEMGLPNCTMARSSCQSHLYYGCVNDGIYHISVYNSNYDATCLMSVDGGGWTSYYAGLNGSPNVFAHFESNATVCPSAASQCLRMAPADLTPTDGFAGACGVKVVKFLMPQAGVSYIQNGTQAGAVNLSNAVVVRGTTTNLPTQFWTGSGADTGWRLQYDYNAHDFASGYSANPAWNQCDLVADTTSPVFLYYKRTNVALALLSTAASTANTLNLVFTDRLDSVTATTPSNYVITDPTGASTIRVSAVTLNSDFKSVTLVVSTLTSKKSYTLTANNVAGLEKMTLIPAATQVSFQAP
jgi:hypothetical protein